MLTLLKAGLAALTLTLLVQDQPFVLEGDYVFTADERGPGGQSVCTEQWSFSGDEWTVHSGQEIVRKRFRIEMDGPSPRWLVSEQIETNGLPDCMGNVTTEIAGGESRIYFLMFNSGDMVLCGPPDHMPDGTVYVGPTCFGGLRRDG